MRRSSQDIAIFFALTLLCPFALMWLAIYNGYPLLYYDSAGYIHDWTQHIRAIGYNIFIRFTSLGISLWFTVFTQSSITAYLILRNAVIVLGKNEHRQSLIAFSILLLLIVLTNLGKYTSWIMPDIFTSWIFLSFLLFLIGPSMHDRLVASAVLFLSYFSHLSHVPLAFSLILVVGITMFLWEQFRATITWKRFRNLFILSGVVVLSICQFNYLHKGFFALSHQGSANFYISHMISWGVVQKVLDKECSARKWRFCGYQDELQRAAGKRHDWFLWNRASPLAKVGGWTDQSEQKEILRQAIKLYPWEILKFAFRDGQRQLLSFQSGFGLLPSKQSMLTGGGYQMFYLPVERFYPQDAPRLDQSKQAQGTFYVMRILPFQISVVIGGILTLAAIIFFAMRKQFFPLALIGFSILFVTFNAFITGALAGVAARKQDRVIWLVLYCVLLSIFAYVSKTPSIDKESPGKSLPQ